MVIPGQDPEISLNFCADCTLLRPHQSLDAKHTEDYIDNKTLIIRPEIWWKSRELCLNTTAETGARKNPSM